MLPTSLHKLPNCLVTAVADYEVTKRSRSNVPTRARQFYMRSRPRRCNVSLVFQWPDIFKSCKFSSPVERKFLFRYNVRILRERGYYYLENLVREIFPREL